MNRKNKVDVNPGKSRNTKRKTKLHAIHKHNPAGSKLIRKYAKAHHGFRMTYEEAVKAW